MKDYMFFAVLVLLRLSSYDFMQILGYCTQKHLLKSKTILLAFCRHIEIIVLLLLADSWKISYNMRIAFIP